MSTPVGRGSEHASTLEKGTAPCGHGSSAARKWLRFVAICGSAWRRPTDAKVDFVHWEVTGAGLGK
jgi:hypothetical protein